MGKGQKWIGKAPSSIRLRGEGVDRLGPKGHTNDRESGVVMRNTTEMEMQSTKSKDGKRRYAAPNKPIY